MVHLKQNDNHKQNNIRRVVCYVRFQHTLQDCQRENTHNQMIAKVSTVASKDFVMR